MNNVRYVFTLGLHRRSNRPLNYIFIFNQLPLSFPKPGHSTELQEWRSILETAESFKTGNESPGNARNLTETSTSAGNSPNASENCAKNLLSDFSAEMTNNSNRSVSASSGQYSGVVPADSDRDSAPVSPAIPARFRKISNITPPRDRRTGVTGGDAFIHS
jgi:hypothetical protein